MLILIGVMPTAYALNRAMPDSQIQPFLRTSIEVAQMLDRYGDGRTAADPRAVAEQYVRENHEDPTLVPALAALVRSIDSQVRQYGSLRLVPAAAVQNVRNDMYLAAESIRHLGASRTVTFEKYDAQLLQFYRSELNGATRFIPTWVKIAVAIALGLGTMVGWKRIVVTVGEKIGKSHLTYAQGASAELPQRPPSRRLVYGLPRPTTHVPVGRRWHHGGERIGPADGHGPQSALPATMPVTSCWRAACSGFSSIF